MVEPRGSAQKSRLLKLALTVGVGVVLWVAPSPAGVEPRAWHLLAVFVSTIIGIVVKPLPMGAVAILGILATVLTGTLAIDQAMSGFANPVIWLIVLAFLIARGFIKTGLSRRVAYGFVALLGKRSLGLGYGLVATDLVLAPAIPSNTARAGGVVFPILLSLSKSYGSEPDDGTAGKMGAFLTLTAFQGTVITSAMFLTAMAANPLAAELARGLGVEVTWSGWALAALVPGLVSLAVVPLAIHRMHPPEIQETPEASALARSELAKMGPMTRNEVIMLATFVILLTLWILGRTLGLDATTAALVGLGILLSSGVLTWSDVLEETEAWNTLVWFAALVMMASSLNELGFIAWFSETMGRLVGGAHWTVAFLGLCLIYFYSHYLFASNTAHVSSMYAPFLGVAMGVGTPPLLAALALGFFSNLFGGLTHYGTGPAPILFGSRYVDLGLWWRMGAVVSAINVLIWLGLGGVWWKFLGYW